MDWNIVSTQTSSHLPPTQVVLAQPLWKKKEKAERAIKYGPHWFSPMTSEHKMHKYKQKHPILANLRRICSPLLDSHLLGQGISYVFVVHNKFDSIRWLCLVLSYTSLLAGWAKRLGSSGCSAPPCLLRHSACSQQQVTQLPAREAQGVQRQRQKLPVFSQSQALQSQPRSREKRKRSRFSTRRMSRVRSHR